MTGCLFDRVAIIGLGLIGSSIARACRAHRLAETVVGCDTNDSALTYARSHDFIDVATKDPAIAARHCQLVILATPPSSLEKVAAAIAPSLTAGMTVMDIASVKEPAMEAVTRHLPGGVEYIPAHPIAGSEQSGVTAGRADLFARKFVIITPKEPTQTPALKKVTSLWKAMGARVEGMPAIMHDRIYAYVSHLPQLLAFGAAQVIDPAKAPSPFLRIAASNPALWTEIFLQNSANVTGALNRYLDAVLHVRKELALAPADAPVAPVKNDYDTLVLFARIAASCLITTVMEAEKTHGFSFARFAGTGFADFTSPATQPPEKDIEQISNHHHAVSALLEQYAAQLQSLNKLIESGGPAALQQALSRAA